MSTAARPPEGGAPSPFATYQAHLDRGELAYQVDEEGRPVFPPRVLTPGSGATTLAWRVASGFGTVHATTVIHARGEPPRQVALVDVDEGFRLMSRVDGVAPDQVRIGQRVRLAVAPADATTPALPVFVPVADGAADAQDAADAPVTVNATVAVHAVDAVNGRGASPLRDGLSRGSVAVVGVAESDLGVVAPGMTPLDLMGQATARALADCGLALADVDGLFCASAQVRFGPLALADYLGIRPRWFDGTQIGGASFMSHLARAQLALEAGLCEVALIAYGSTQRSVSRAAASPPDPNPYELPFRPLLPTSAYALAASRHFHRFGTTRSHLAEVAVAARQWALLNPAAWEKTPLAIDEVLGARMVSSPLSVRDCCLVSDGGGAMIVTKAARARALAKPPVHVLGIGESLGHLSISTMADLTVTPARESGAQAFARAGLAPADVDVLQLYDAFTITPILFLEDLGFCPKGEGGRFVAGGAIAPGGRLPVNTNGGGLSYCHPGMYGLLAMIEAVRQVRGECGARQVPDCAVALAHGNGVVLSSQCTVLFGSADTL